MTPIVQASAALAESLFDDPFYWAITDGLGEDHPARKLRLRRYFQYSLEEAKRTGRCVIASDPKLGATAWLLPRTAEVDAAETAAKSQFLGDALGSRGRENYYRIVRYMAPLAAKVIPAGAWYLSIIGVLPSAQGQGLGAALLAETLAEASRLNAVCYLETFSPRNLRFYQRMDFRRVAQHLEPTTNKEYVVMRRG
jgi:GNAT superfamily N-acetyltransferase